MTLKGITLKEFIIPHPSFGIPINSGFDTLPSAVDFARTLAEELKQDISVYRLEAGVKYQSRLLTGYVERPTNAPS